MSGSRVNTTNITNTANTVYDLQITVCVSNQPEHLPVLHFLPVVHGVLLLLVHFDDHLGTRINVQYHDFVPDGIHTLSLTSTHGKGSYKPWYFLTEELLP